MDGKLSGKANTNHGHKVLYDFKDGGHTIGITWDTKGLNFYVDDILVRQW